MSNQLKKAPRAFDAGEHPDFYQPTEDRPDPREDFVEGFAEVTGIARNEVYAEWLRWSQSEPNPKSQMWVNHQEEGGFESGQEQGRDYVNMERPNAGAAPTAYPNGRW